MRETLDKLLNKLGVGRLLEPYETHPWLHYDEEKGITCSAEIRMGPGGEDLEAEIQFFNDETDDDDDKGDGDSTSGPEQIMRMRALPVSDNEWSPVELVVKGEDYVNKMHDWEGKCCDFFRACIQSIQMGDLPEIDELLKQELSDNSAMGGESSGRIGRKSPVIKPGQLLGMKK